MLLFKKVILPQAENGSYDWRFWQLQIYELEDQKQ